MMNINKNRIFKRLVLVTTTIGILFVTTGCASKKANANEQAIASLVATVNGNVEIDNATHKTILNELETLSDELETLSDEVGTLTVEAEARVAELLVEVEVVEVLRGSDFYSQWAVEIFDVDQMLDIDLFFDFSKVEENGVAKFETKEEFLRVATSGTTQLTSGIYHANAIIDPETGRTIGNRDNIEKIVNSAPEKYRDNLNNALIDYYNAKDGDKIAAMEWFNGITKAGSGDVYTVDSTLVDSPEDAYWLWVISDINYSTFIEATDSRTGVISDKDLYPNTVESLHDNVIQPSAGQAAFDLFTRTDVMCGTNLLGAPVITKQ